MAHVGKFIAFKFYSEIPLMINSIRCIIWGVDIMHRCINQVKEIRGLKVE